MEGAVDGVRSASLAVCPAGTLGEVDTLLFPVEPDADRGLPTRKRMRFDMFLDVDRIVVVAATLPHPALAPGAAV